MHKSRLKSKRFWPERSISQSHLLGSKVEMTWLPAATNCAQKDVLYGVPQKCAGIEIDNDNVRTSRQSALFFKLERTPSRS
jgi:hypothetical protein